MNDQVSAFYYELLVVKGGDPFDPHCMYAFYARVQAILNLCHVIKHD